MTKLTWRTRVSTSVLHDDGLILSAVVQTHGLAKSERGRRRAGDQTHRALLTRLIRHRPTNVQLIRSRRSRNLHNTTQQAQELQNKCTIGKKNSSSSIIVIHLGCKQSHLVLITNLYYTQCSNKQQEHDTRMKEKKKGI